MLLNSFLNFDFSVPIIDVRSPSEYRSGHVPGAFNLVLFSDQERSEIGTIYKQQGKISAVNKGLEIVGPKMNRLVSEVEERFGTLPDRKLVLYCWRGGMRSESVEWLLKLVGWEILRIKGGYKSWRRWVLEGLDRPRPWIVLTGLTGSGKTDILRKLKEKEEQVIDLEKLAAHKGSSFGSLGEKDQPTVEHFENLLFYEILHLKSAETFTWIEDESRNIGKVILPEKLWFQLHHSPVIQLLASKEYRVRRLVKEYGIFPPTDLAQAILRLQKKLGGLCTQQLLQALEAHRLEEVAASLLDYYDKTYWTGFQRQQGNVVAKVEVDGKNETEILDELICLRTKIKQRSL